MNQLQSSGVPEIYWPGLFSKLKDEVFDAGSYFQIVQRVDEDDNVIGYKALCINELDTNDPIGIFLIDHAWTYKVNEARQILLKYDQLVDRMCGLMNINVDEVDEEESQEKREELERAHKIDAILEKMWKFNQTYKLSTEKLSDDEREAIWYVMDEFGSSIRHNSNPTVEVKPFCYLPSKTMFSIMWPIKDLNQGDELTRDYVYGLKDPFLRKYRLIPWNDEEENEELIHAVNGDATYHEEPSLAYFQSGRQDETLADLANLDPATGVMEKQSDIKVFTDIEAVATHLTDSKFKIVDHLEEADIIFIKKHFKDFKSLYERNPRCLVNQFPYENVVTVKDLLAIVCRRVEDSSKWLPETYNLSYELAKFVSYFKQREEDELDNYWILKPWNLARSIDMTITNNLNQIIRSIETGPKIACKYISNPVLFTREIGSVKFDIRYIILLRSIEPLTIYTYNVFWLRFANKPYSLDSFDEYEKHFTVMNYKPVNLKQINYDEFIPEFEKQYSDFKWNDIQQKIFKMIRQVFEGASNEKHPKGIPNNPQSRAMYAVDLMLDWRQDANNNSKTIEPVICEMNFMPDCTRACKYHPNFFNDVFNTLFMDCLDHESVTQI